MIFLYEVHPVQIFLRVAKVFLLYEYRAFACDVMAAMLVYLDKRILNIFF